MSQTMSIGQSNDRQNGSVSGTQGSIGRNDTSATTDWEIWPCKRNIKGASALSINVMFRFHTTGIMFILAARAQFLNQFRHSEPLRGHASSERVQYQMRVWTWRPEGGKQLYNKNSLQTMSLLTPTANYEGHRCFTTLLCAPYHNMVVWPLSFKFDTFVFGFRVVEGTQRITWYQLCHVIVLLQPKHFSCEELSAKGWHAFVGNVVFVFQPKEGMRLPKQVTFGCVLLDISRCLRSHLTMGEDSKEQRR